MIFVHEAKPPSRKKVLAVLEAIFDLMPEKPMYVKGTLERADMSSLDAQISGILQAHEGVSADKQHQPPTATEFEIEWDVVKLSREKLLALAKLSIRKDDEYIASSQDTPKIKLNEICWRLFYGDSNANMVFGPENMRTNIYYKGKEPARMYKLIDVMKGNRVGACAYVEGYDTLGKPFVPEKFLSGLERLVKKYHNFEATAMPAVEPDYSSATKQLASMDKEARLAKRGISDGFIPLLASPESVVRLARNTLSYYASRMAQRTPSLLLKSVRWYFEKTTNRGMNLSVNLFDDGGNKLLDVPHIELAGQIEKGCILLARKAFAGSGVELHVRGSTH